MSGVDLPVEEDSLLLHVLGVEPAPKVDELSPRLEAGIERLSAIDRKVRDALEKARADLARLNKESSSPANRRTAFMTLFPLGVPASCLLDVAGRPPGGVFLAAPPPFVRDGEVEQTAQERPVDGGQASMVDTD